MRAHSMRNDNQILHGDQTRCEENFYMVDHVRMRTRDLFAVAKLLERIAIAFNFREPIKCFGYLLPVCRSVCMLFLFLLYY